MSNKVIQYHHGGLFHERYWTVMVHVPPKDELLSLLKDHCDLNLIVGSVRRNPKDQFVKKIGRNLAMKNSKMQCFELHKVLKRDDKFVFQLFNKDKKDLTHSIHLEIKKDRKTVYLINSTVGLLRQRD